MAELVLEQLSDPPIDEEADFETGEHEKGMQQGALPDGLREDLNSGYCPTSDVNMVKPPNKCPHKEKTLNPSKEGKSKKKREPTWTRVEEEVHPEGYFDNDLIAEGSQQMQGAR